MKKFKITMRIFGRAYSAIFQANKLKALFAELKKAKVIYCIEKAENPTHD